MSQLLVGGSTFEKTIQKRKKADKVRLATNRSKPSLGSAVPSSYATRVSCPLPEEVQDGVACAVKCFTSEMLCERAGRLMYSRVQYCTNVVYGTVLGERSMA